MCSLPWRLRRRAAPRAQFGGVQGGPRKRSGLVSLPCGDADGSAVGALPVTGRRMFCALARCGQRLDSCRRARRGRCDLAGLRMQGTCLRHTDRAAGGSRASAAARHWRGQCRMRGGGRRPASTGRSFRQCSGRAAAGAWLFPCGFAGGLSVFCRASRDCFVAIRNQASARTGRCANGLRNEARQRRHPRRDASFGDRPAPR